MSVLEEVQKEEHVPKKNAESDRIQRYWRRFNSSKTSAQNKHELWSVLDMFDRGEQWKDVSLPPWIPKPMTNMVRYLRTLKRANLASAIPQAHYTPLHPEMASLVQKLHKAYTHVWQSERVDRTVRRCIDRALLQGTSVGYVYNDEDYVGGVYKGEGNSENQLFQGRICVKRFPIMNFFPDPDAYHIDYCKYVETTEIVPTHWIVHNPAFRAYAGDKLDEIKFKDCNTFEDDTNGTIFDRDSKPGQNMNERGDETAVLHTHFERFRTKGGKWQLDITYYLEGVDFELLRIEDAKPNVYPFALLHDEEEENDIFGTSTIMDILENQKVINKTSQVSSIIATMHQNPQKIISKTSGISAQEMARTGTLPGKTWTANGDPSKAIHVLQPPEIPRGLYEVEDRMKQDIRDMAGVNEAYTGQSIGSLTTSTGVNSLIERATLRDKDKMVQIDEFVERISDLIILFIAYKWKDKRPIVTQGANGQPEYDTYEPISEAEIDNLEWIVKSDIYAKAPTTQILRRQQADNLMQMQGQFQYNPPIITPEEWIRFQDFDMKEEILSRMQKDRALLEAQRPEELTQQILQVAQAIQQAKAQGATEEQSQQIAQQVATQIVQAQQQLAAQAASAKNADQLNGTVGSLSMQAMAQGG